MDKKKGPKSDPRNMTLLRMYDAGDSMEDIISATGLTKKAVNSRLYRFGRNMIYAMPETGKFIDRFKAEWEKTTGMIRPYL